jgi:tetratricopeptide (TPR) repeat protein
MELTPTMLPQMIEKAKKLFGDGEYEQSAALFEKIYQAYDAAGDEVNSAENKNNCSVALLKADDPQKSLQCVLGSDQIFARAGDSKRQAMSLGNQAAAYEALGDIDKALETYQQASALLKESGEKELRSYVLKSISALEMRKGKLGESMVSMQAAIDSEKSPSWIDRFLRKLLSFIFKH